MNFEISNNGLESKVVENKHETYSTISIYEGSTLKVNFSLLDYQENDAELVVDNFRVMKYGSYTAKKVFDNFYSIMNEVNIDTLIFRFLRGKNFPLNQIRLEYVHTDILKECYNYGHQSLTYIKSSAENLPKKKIIQMCLGEIEDVQKLKLEKGKKSSVNASFKILSDCLNMMSFNISFCEDTFTGRFNEGLVLGNYVVTRYHNSAFNPIIIPSNIEVEADSFKNLTFDELKELIMEKGGLEE